MNYGSSSHEIKSTSSKARSLEKINTNSYVPAFWLGTKAEAVAKRAKRRTRVRLIMVKIAFRSLQKITRSGVVANKVKAKIIVLLVYDTLRKLSTTLMTFTDVRSSGSTSTSPVDVWPSIVFDILSKVSSLIFGKLHDD